MSNPFDFLIPVIREVWMSGGSDSEAFGICLHCIYPGLVPPPSDDDDTAPSQPLPPPSAGLPRFSFAEFNALIQQEVERNSEYRNEAMSASAGLTGAAKVAMKRRIFQMDSDFALRVAQLTVPEYAPKQNQLPQGSTFVVQIYNESERKRMGLAEGEERKIIDVESSSK